MQNKKISVVTPHVPINDRMEKMLQDCMRSIEGQYDELVLVVNNGEGYAKSFNRGFKYSTGEYILAISNDTFLEKGLLKDLCDPSAVTYTENQQWGCFFCLPRWIYEKVGGFDESFGLAYWEDHDYLIRLDQAGVPVKRIPGVVIHHEGGATVKALGKESEAAAFAKEVFIKKWGAQKV